MYLLEIDPEVLSYHSQPLTIVYTLDNQQRKYTPDFLVKRRNLRQIVEIKPESQVRTAKNLKLFRCIAPLCQERGWEFSVVTDTMIRVQPLLDNLKLLYKYAREPLTYKNYLDCHQYFREGIAISLQKAQQDLTSKQISRPTLMKLIFCGVLETDLMKPIGSESLITRTKVQLSL